MKKLTSKHLKAAKLIWEGKPYREVATLLGAGLSSVKGWAIDPLFKAEVERLKNEQADRTKTELDEAAKFQAQLRQQTRDFYGAVHERISTAIEQLPPEGLSRSLPPLVKAMCDASQLALSVDQETLGLEALAKDLDGLKTKKSR